MDGCQRIPGLEHLGGAMMSPSPDLRGLGLILSYDVHRMCREGLSVNVYQNDQYCV